MRRPLPPLLAGSGCAARRNRRQVFENTARRHPDVNERAEGFRGPLLADKRANHLTPLVGLKTTLAWGATYMLNLIGRRLQAAVQKVLKIPVAQGVALFARLYLLAMDLLIC